MKISFLSFCVSILSIYFHSCSRISTDKISESFFLFTGPAINPIVIDSDEPHPSLSDWHDYEPNLEFDDTELTHPPDASQIVLDDEDFVSGKWMKVQCFASVTKVYLKK